MAANALTKPMNEQTLAKAEDIATSIESVTREFGLVALREKPPIVQAIQLAQGVQKMRAILTPEFVEFMFMPLMGSPLGFLTDLDNDKDGKRYTATEVRDVLVEALLRGYMPTGNEFNIIAKRFFGAKNGTQRLVETYPGLANLRLTPGVPEMAPNNTALIAYKATWTFQGEPDELICTRGKGPDGVEYDERIPVKVNSGMGPDALLGKAEAKIYKRILKRINANAATLLGPDADEVAINTTETPAPIGPGQDGRRMQLGAKSEATPNGETTGASGASG
jgi:hypothetical protein